LYFFFSSRRRHTRSKRDWSSDVCSSDLFYNAQSGEGANYWVSFKDHGIYLFHTVPVDANGNYVVSEAEQLGKSSNSHGCVRLSVADAKWFYENIKTGTKVVVE